MYIVNCKVVHEQEKFNVWSDRYVLVLQKITMSEENQEMVKLKDTKQISRSSSKYDFKIEIFISLDQTIHFPYRGEI
jgi:hypothetical protein